MLPVRSSNTDPRHVCCSGPPPPNTHPPPQPDELAVLTRFPPKQLADLVAQRDVLLKYSGDNPVRGGGRWRGGAATARRAAPPWPPALPLLPSACQ